MHTKDMIRNARKTLGMNRAEFSVYLGASHGSIVRWESGAEPGRMGRKLLEKAFLEALEKTRKEGEK